jgi:hypothetical protein
MRSIPLALVLALPLSAAAQSMPPAPTPPAHAPTLASLAGDYDGGQMEVGAELALLASGHFRYQLAYGALDESASGTWEVHDGAVFLTTVPAVVPPHFTVLSDQPDPRGGLWITISNGPVMEGANQTVYLLYGDAPPSNENPPSVADVAPDGHVPLPDKGMPRAIILAIPVVPVIDKPIPLTGAAGHHLTVRFDPNGIGNADFRAQRLDLQDGVLVMTRPDLELQLHFKLVKHLSPAKP